MRVFLYIPEILAGFLPLLLLISLFRLRGGNLKNYMLSCFLGAYFVCVYVLTGLPNVLYVRFEPNLNLIPFKDILKDLKNAVLNVALFVPLGFLLPLVSKRYVRFCNTAAFGVCFCVCIEFFQLFTFRATDINDLITNTLGCMLGFVLAKPFGNDTDECKRGVGQIIPGLICIESALIMFFVQPLIITVL